MLKRGSSGAGVEDLQRHLLANGINPGPVDGLFGPKTEEAVRRFQERNSLQVDGIAGPKTMKALEDAKANADGPNLTSGATAGATTAGTTAPANAGTAGAVKAGNQAAAANVKKAAAAKDESAVAKGKQVAAAAEAKKEKETTDKVGGVFSRIFKKNT